MGWVTIDEPDHEDDTDAGPSATRNQAGHIFLQEDGSGEQFIRGVTRNGQIYDFAKTAANETEFAGGCFDPLGQVLFVNQQGDRGNLPDGPPDAGAVTCAIFGPWKAVD